MWVCDWLKVPCWIVLFEHPHYSECPQGSPLLISVSLTDRENHTVIMFKTNDQQRTMGQVTAELMAARRLTLTFRQTVRQVGQKIAET